MKTVLTFNKISKKIDRFNVLNTLSFQIPENKIVGLIGANGAGKTTILRHIIRYLNPNEGEILYKGKNIYSLADKSFPIAFVPDVPIYFEELSVQEHLSFISTMYQTEEQVKELIDSMEMYQHLEKVPSELSKGTKQKLSLMCALLRQYDFFIADEPFTGLDPKQISNLKNTLLKIKANGKTILLSTHLLGMVENLCDYYIFIDNGSLMAQGTMEELVNFSNEASLEEIYLNLKSKNNRFQSVND